MLRYSLRPAFARHGFLRKCRAPSALATRTMIAPPAPNSGPLMERRADRELPDIPTSSGRWMKTIPIFLVILVGSTLAIFNYQKSSSSIVNATLYALRTSPRAREELGDEIYFRDKFPWIWGEMNQLHGRIDISFGVKGNKASGWMKFRSFRPTRNSYVSASSREPLRYKD
jgi:cytochrome c oxidase assembly factor 1